MCSFLNFLIIVLERRHRPQPDITDSSCIIVTRVNCLENRLLRYRFVSVSLYRLPKSYLLYIQRYNCNILTPFSFTFLQFNKMKEDLKKVIFKRLPNAW